MSSAQQNVFGLMDFEGLDNMLDDLACDFSLFDNVSGDAPYEQPLSAGIRALPTNATELVVLPTSTMYRALQVIQCVL
jgi:hypothetical protein